MTTHEQDHAGGERADGEGGPGTGEAGDTDALPSRTHLSVAGLRSRGWTAGMVRHLLGEPDLFGVSPHVRSAPPTRLYLAERVEAAERSDEFRAVAAAAARRSGTRKAADRRRRRELLRRRAAAIAQAPPDLAQERERQLRERQCGPPPA